MQQFNFFIRTEIVVVNNTDFTLCTTRWGYIFPNKNKALFP
jgi:hypothetical protein